MRKRTKLLLVGLVLAAAAGGTAYATIPDGSGVIHGCVGSGGALKVIDPSTGGRCGKNETALDWGQQGPPGPAGPPGAAGVVGNLDQLEGVPCRGVDGKIATVHLAYGSGIEAPVQIVCVTHLVKNPGPFGVTITGGEFQIFAGGFPIPGGSLNGGQIDFGGRITAPGSGFTIDAIPFDWSQDFPGFASVHVAGTASFTSEGITGSLVPGDRAMTVTDPTYATITFSATFNGATLYAGTCTLGTAASPIPLTLSGNDYSQTTGNVTLSGAVDAPDLADCSPGLGIYGFFVGILAGHETVTLNATVQPVITAP